MNQIDLSVNYVQLKVSVNVSNHNILVAVACDCGDIVVALIRPAYMSDNNVKCVNCFTVDHSHSICFSRTCHVWAIFVVLFLLLYGHYSFSSIFIQCDFFIYHLIFIQIAPSLHQKLHDQWSTVFICTHFSDRARTSRSLGFAMSIIVIILSSK